MQNSLKIFVFLIVFLSLSKVTFAEDPLSFLNLKSGGWESETVTESIPPSEFGIPKSLADLCFDEAAKAKLANASKGLSDSMGCKSSAVVHNGNTFAYDLTCTFGGYPLTTHFEYTIISDTNFQMTVSQGASNTTMITKTNNKYIGDCIPGMKPGEIRMRTGGVNTTVNTEALINQTEALIKQRIDLNKKAR
jgi:hypothetical protein